MNGKWTEICTRNLRRFHRNMLKACCVLSLLSHWLSIGDLHSQVYVCVVTAYLFSGIFVQSGDHSSWPCLPEYLDWREQKPKDIRFWNVPVSKGGSGIHQHITWSPPSSMDGSGVTLSQGFHICLGRVVIWCGAVGDMHLRWVHIM